MTKEQIIALAKQFPFEISGCTQALEKANAILAEEQNPELQGCANHLDDDFMAFLRSGDHLDEAILPYSI